jgi:hypothetical protein
VGERLVQLCLGAGRDLVERLAGRDLLLQCLRDELVALVAPDVDRQDAAGREAFATCSERTNGPRIGSLNALATGHADAGPR